MAYRPRRRCERVLVLNDNEDMVASLKDLLEVHGVAVRGAVNPKELHEALASPFHPSAIVMDLRLGGGVRGDELARRLREDPRYAQVPIVLMSGDVRELRRLEPLADAVVVKPFDPDELLRRLEEVCGGMRADPPGS